MSSPVPVFVYCRDLVSPLRKVVDWLERAGQYEIYLVDNDSQWPPLLAYLDSSPHHVVRLRENFGKNAVWAGRVLETTGVTGRYVVTDPDVVPIEECPSDVLDRFSDLLDRYPNVLKVGFGLRIDDLPDSFRYRQAVADWEQQFWLEELEPRVFYADIASTFALYREGTSGMSLAPALRTGWPYVARHLPWYDDSTQVSEEQVFYQSRAIPGLSNWTRESLPDALTEALESQRARPRLRTETQLLMPWVVEREPGDEQEFTPWAEAGWHSWNAYSPEREFCDFVGSFVRLSAPSAVLETGVGQGYTTRRVAAAMRPGARLVCFESDAELRSGLSHLPFFGYRDRSLAEAANPSAADYAAADVTILDSASDERWQEIEVWYAHARDGAALIVHDTGNGHDESTVHARNARTIRSLDIPGVFLKNPRGSFVGFRPDRGRTAALADASARAEAAEAAVRAIRATRSYRWLQPLRGAWGRWLRRTGRR